MKTGMTRGKSPKWVETEISLRGKKGGEQRGYEDRDEMKRGTSIQLV